MASVEGICIINGFNQKESYYCQEQGNTGDTQFAPGNGHTNTSSSMYILSRLSGKNLLFPGSLATADAQDKPKPPPALHDFLWYNNPDIFPAGVEPYEI